MSYIGKSPTVGNFQVCDAISTVNGQASYTMQVDSVNVVPESAHHMLVSLNGILQKSGSSFTVSGSTITFASNLVTGDVIDFIQILGNVLDLGVPSDATVTNAKTNFVSTSSSAGLQIKGDGTTDGTLQLNCSQNSHGIKLKSPPHSASASYTLTFPNNDGDADQVLTTNGSGVLTWASAGGTNTPCFEAYASSSQGSISNNTWTKLQFNTEVFDVGSGYDNVNDKFVIPSGNAGKYYIYSMAQLYAPYDANQYSKIAIYKNGSVIVQDTADYRHDDSRVRPAKIFSILDLAVSDYIEIYVLINAESGVPELASGSGRGDGGYYGTRFGAYKIIE